MDTKLSSRNRTKIGKNLRELRDRTGYTCEEVAEAIKKTRSYMYQLERGVFSVPLAVLLQLQKLYGLKSLQAILRGVKP